MKKDDQYFFGCFFVILGVIFLSVYVSESLKLPIVQKERTEIVKERDVAGFVRGGKFIRKDIRCVIITENNLYEVTPKQYNKVKVGDKVLVVYEYNPNNKESSKGSVFKILPREK